MRKVNELTRTESSSNWLDRDVSTSYSLYEATPGYFSDKENLIPHRQFWFKDMSNKRPNSVMVWVGISQRFAGWFHSKRDSHTLKLNNLWLALSQLAWNVSIFFFSISDAALILTENSFHIFIALQMYEDDSASSAEYHFKNTICNHFIKSMIEGKDSIMDGERDRLWLFILRQVLANNEAFNYDQMARVLVQKANLVRGGCYELVNR